MIKKLLTFIFEPLRAFSNRNFAEKLSLFYQKNKWISVFLALLITLVIVFFTYVFPNL